ncbi:MAG: hypothetical protein HQK52_19070 [Oligoflexia bacterium]|nr:hypothetical protein [Oligoflexia bacterium]
MVHCSVFCPVGVITNYLGKLNPFRLKVNRRSCSLCLECISTCKYGALDPLKLKAGKVDPNCSLCLDCLPGCDHQAL